MTRSITLKTGAMALAASSAALASPPQRPSSASPQPLIDGIHAVRQAIGVDRDQGDDHASARAILVVCSHDNPSAQRSAICPVPNSPP